MKWFHNSPISTFLAVALEIIIHGLFAIGAIPLGVFIGDLALRSVSPQLANAIGGYGLAATIFLLAMYAFVYAEYSKEHISAYESKVGDGTYMRSWKELRYIVAGAELASLLFRCFAIGSDWSDPVAWLQRILLFGFGLLMLRMAYNLGKVIHAIANRPAETMMYQTMQDVGRDLVKETTDLVRYMTPGQKSRLYNDDFSVLDEVRDERWNERETTEKIRRQREENQRAERERAENATFHILKPRTYGAKRFQNGADPNQSEVTRQVHV